MSLFELPFDKTPDFVNEKGVKWWIDRDTTRYAHSKLNDKVAVWYIEEPDGNQCRLITENDEILYDNTSLEAVLCYIDILCVARKPHEDKVQCPIGLREMTLTEKATQELKDILDNPNYPTHEGKEMPNG